MKKQPKHTPSSTFGLSSDKLARIWSIGSETGDRGTGTEEEQRADLLRDLLAETLPLDPMVSQLLPRLVSQLCERLRPFTGASFVDLLIDPQTDVSVLKAVKGFCKDRVDSAKSEKEHDVATTVYYAAIASALVFHDARITKFSYAHLRESLAELLGGNWLTPEVKDLFDRACKICGDKVNET